MSSTTKISGDVTITLDGEEHILRPSLKAATTLSNQFNGLSNAFDGLVVRNLGVYQAIVKAGIVTADRISTKDLQEHVWRAGMSKLSTPLTDFLTVLNNGGVDPDEDADKSAGNGDDADEGNGHHGG